MLEIFWSTGALLGAAAFGWEAWREFTDRTRRRWGDDLRAALVRVQQPLTVLTRSPKDRDWVNAHLVPMEEELRAVAQRMPTSVRRQQVQALVADMALCHACAEVPELRSMSQIELSVRAGEQVATAKEALGLTLQLLRRL